MKFVVTILQNYVFMGQKYHKEKRPLSVKFVNTHLLKVTDLKVFAKIELRHFCWKEEQSKIHKAVEAVPVKLPKGKIFLRMVTNAKLIFECTLKRK